MQPRHRWPAALALALPTVLLSAPAALAQSQPETVPGGASGTRLELLAIGLAVGGVLLVGGAVLVFLNRPKRSRTVEEEFEDEEFEEEQGEEEQGEVASEEDDAPPPAPLDGPDAPRAAER